MNIDILFEDENMLVINKPSGIVVHPFDHSTEETLVDFLQEYSPVVFSIENPVTLQDGRTINLGGIVHKLDRDTSGAMVIAKTKDVFDELKNQFRNHTAQKTYLALVEGRIDLWPSHEPADSGPFIIDAPLGRNKKEYKQSVNPKNPRGELRDAVTEVLVRMRNENTTLVELQPKTGRTHQLRAHMSHIGHSIVGDKAYGSNMESPRIMLHAKSLTIVIGGETFNFEAPTPPSFS
jgi:23S rRNA pseudouridine1911/1915/1917 synthase